jgi:hypothetical protein
MNIIIIIIIYNIHIVLTTFPKFAIYSELNDRFLCSTSRHEETMNTKLFFMAVAIVAAFGIAVAVAGPFTVTTPAMAQNATGDNATMMAGNMTADNKTGNWTK